MNGQDKGLDHIHYIRDLANEIWCKENNRINGKKLPWDDCIRKALRLHVGGLIRNQNHQLSVITRSR